MKNKLSIFALSMGALVYSQVGINTDTPNEKSLLHVSEQLGSQPKIYRGILTPRYTTAERDVSFALTAPDNGLLIYNTTEGCFNHWRQTDPAYATNNGKWISLCGDSQPVEVNCPPSETFIYKGVSVTYGVIKSPAGRCWLDRNLGATQAATSLDDSSAYGDYFQWGRAADGHQQSNSATYAGPVANANNNASNAWYGRFVNTDGSVSWYSTGDDSSLWSATGGTNNPCPSGYHVPTNTEWEKEKAAGTNTNATSFANLKLTRAGIRSANGTVAYTGVTGSYQSSTSENANNGRTFGTFNGNTSQTNKSIAVPIRCIKN